MEEIIKVTKVYNRGKTQIPADIVKSLGLIDGDRIVWIRDDNGRYYIRKSSKLDGRIGKYTIIE